MLPYISPISYSHTQPKPRHSDKQTDRRPENQTDEKTNKQPDKRNDRLAGPTELIYCTAFLIANFDD